MPGLYTTLSMLNACAMPIFPELLAIDLSQTLISVYFYGDDHKGFIYFLPRLQVLINNYITLGQVCMNLHPAMLPSMQILWPLIIFP